MDLCGEDKDLSVFQDAVLNSLAKLNKAGLQLKPQQFDALSSIVTMNRDTICVLPTGFGKLLIYQLLPLMFDYLYPCGESHVSSSSVLVISPLNALMIDQISKLKDHLTVTIMKGNTTYGTKSDEHSSGDFNQLSQIIFAHPEALLEDKKTFEDVLKSDTYKKKLKAIVDEAHLVVEW